MPFFHGREQMDESVVDSTRGCCISSNCLLCTTISRDRDTIYSQLMIIEDV